VVHHWVDLKIILVKRRKNKLSSDEKFRSCIEGKFGQAKRRFSLNRVMTKLSHTSKTTIAITFLVMNLCSYLLQLFTAFLCLFLKYEPFLHIYIRNFL
jgi:transposase, IS5 family